MLCAKFLKQRDESRYGRLYRISEDAFQWIHHEYNSALRWVLRHQWIMLSVAIGCAFLNVYLFIIVPKGFFPQQDTGRLGGRTRAAQDISFPAMRDKQRQLAQMVLEDPAVQTVTAFVGGGGPGGGSTNVGRMFIALKPLSQRPYEAYGNDWFDRLRQKLHIHPSHVSADEVVNGLRRKLTSVPGATLFLQAQQDIQIGGRGSDAQYQYTLSDENLNELNTWAPRLLARMRTMPQLRDAPPTSKIRGFLQPSSSIVTPQHASASPHPPSTRSSTMPSVSARSPPCTPASISTSWSWRSIPNISSVPTPSTTSTSRPAQSPARLPP